jgi:NAD+ synthase (glutamine-hydrolysing)
MMPSRYTAQMSLDDAAQEARTLGVGYDVISIEGMFEAALGALKPVFTGRAPDTTEEKHPGALPRSAADGHI